MSLDDFTPADDPADNLDEDLFDFPRTGSSEESPQASASPEQDEPSPESDSDELELDAVEPDGADADPIAAPLPSVDPLDEDDLGSVDMNLDDEDQDIFGFPSVGGVLPLDEPQLAVPDPELEEASEATSLSRQIDDEDLEEIIRAAKEEQRQNPNSRVIEKSAEPQAEADILETEPVAPEDFAELAEELDSLVPQAAGMNPSQVHAAPLFASVAGAPKALWVLTGTAMVFMVGLLLIAWNFTSAFERQIEASKERSAAAFSEGPGPQRPVIVQSQSPVNQAELSTQSVPEPSRLVESSLGPSRKLPALDDPHESTLIVAESAIGDGRFVHARRMLFGLLAKVDRLPAEQRNSAEQRASFLIAHSYKSEADSLRGGQQ